MQSAFSASEAECHLRKIVADMELDVSRTDAKYLSLYHSSLSVRPRPVPFFGRVHDANYLTISPNPSPDDVGAPTANCDLTQHCFDYFSSRFQPHDFFRNWRSGLAAFSPSQLSYSSTLSHVDLSPRATRSLTAINNSNDHVKLFKEMIEHDIKYLFDILAVVWPNLRGLFAAGAGTKSKYIDNVLANNGRRYGFAFQPVERFPAVPNRASNKPASQSADACPKLYDVSYGQQTIPMFFCPVGPSARRPGQQEQFQTQFSDNAILLRQVFFSNGRN